MSKARKPLIELKPLIDRDGMQTAQFLAMLAADEKYRRRHAPSRRRDAIIKRWQTVRRGRRVPTVPPPPGEPATWKPHETAEWLRSVAESDIRVYLARLVEIDLTPIEAAQWWFGLTDRERFDIELAGHAAVHDEQVQERRRRKKSSLEFTE
jgi:hypothetical protein